MPSTQAAKEAPWWRKILIPTLVGLLLGAAIFTLPELFKKEVAGIVAKK